MNKFRNKRDRSFACFLSVFCITSFPLLVTLSPILSLASEFIFMPEHPGTVSVIVENLTTFQKKLLTKEDAAAFKHNLERFRNLLANQKVFNPPRGVAVKGYLRFNGEVETAKNQPIPGYGFLQFYFYFLDNKSGKPARICCTTDEIYVSVNDPDSGFDSFGVSGFPTKAFYEPKRVGELNGFPVYQAGNGDEIIVLSRSTTPPWVPVTREEYVNVWIKFWQKTADSTPQDTLSPDVVRRHKAALAGMSASEREMQAHHLTTNPLEPTFAPVGSDAGLPLVRTNQAWFNSALPRAAFQLVTLRFKYTGNLDHNKPGPTEYGDVSPLRVWEALHTSNWAEISGVLMDK